MIKKLLPILLSGVLLIVILLIPKCLIDQNDYELINYDSQTTIKERIEYITNEELSFKERLDFLSLYASDNSNSILAIEENDEPFETVLTYNQIDLLYKQIQKIESYNGIISLSKDELRRYYDCTLNTYQYENIIISLNNLYILSTNQDIIINIWFDNVTCEIYQYSIVDRRNTSALKDIDVHHAMMKYLNMEESEYKKYYTSHSDDINKRVELLKTIQK